jgi:hypothetical protein
VADADKPVDLRGRLDTSILQIMRIEAAVSA